ncbi:unnamed protein product [Boreogadus saida]
MSPLPEAFAGHSPQIAMEAGGAGKPGEVAFVARDACKTVTAEPPMSPLPEAFAGRSPQPAMEAGGAGKPGEAALVKPHEPAPRGLRWPLTAACDGGGRGCWSLGAGQRSLSPGFTPKTAHGGIQRRYRPVTPVCQTLRLRDLDKCFHRGPEPPGLRRSPTEVRSDGGKCQPDRVETGGECRGLEPPDAMQLVRALGGLRHGHRQGLRLPW